MQFTEISLLTPYKAQHACAGKANGVLERQTLWPGVGPWVTYIYWQIANIASRSAY